MNRETMLARKREAREAAERARAERVERFVFVRSDAELTELAIAHRMRRWWLDRYTLEEIRELAAGFEVRRGR